MNCNVRDGIRGWAILKTISRISLIPYTAMIPGINKIIRATIRCISNVGLTFKAFDLYYSRKYLAQRRKKNYDKTVQDISHLL
jgi:hypothetical protein